METLPRPPRLQRRRHRFYFRAAVPGDVQAAVGSTEVIRSLKTGDYREALRFLSEFVDPGTRRCPT